MASAEPAVTAGVPNAETADEKKDTAEPAADEPLNS
jgi:hypothetical protein